MAADAAAKLIKIVFADYGVTQGRDVLEEITCAYLVWLGLEHGRAEIDRLMRERINKHTVRRSEKKIELVVNNSAQVVG